MIMSSRSQQFRQARSGLTLIELLIVCFIIVLFVAVAAPLLRPNTNETKLREAARQLNAYFAEAKSYAAQRAKNVALVLDRSATEGARDSNIVTRLYLAESPPTYSGDTLSATIAVWSHPYSVPGTPRQQPFVNGLTPPYVNNSPPHLLVMDFLPGNPMADVIAKSYWPNPQPNDRIPFTIRLGNPGSPTVSGPWYQGLAIYQPTAPLMGIPGREVQYYIVAQYNQPWYLAPAYPYSIPPMYDAPPPNPPEVPSPYPPPPYPNSAIFQMNFPPQNSSASNLELPTGTCVDLLFSGYQYYDYTPGIPEAQAEPTTSSFLSSSNTPLYIVFGPGGDVQYVLGDNSGINYQPTRISLLVGTTDRAIDSSTDGSFRTSNLNDRTAQWVSVNARTGYVSTADNAGFDTVPPEATTMTVAPGDPAYKGTAIGRARAMAASLNTKGGR